MKVSDLHSPFLTNTKYVLSLFLSLLFVMACQDEGIEDSIGYDNGIGFDNIKLGEEEILQNAKLYNAVQQFGQDFGTIDLTHAEQITLNVITSVTFYIAVENQAINDLYNVVFKKEKSGEYKPDYISHYSIIDGEIEAFFMWVNKENRRQLATRKMEMQDPPPAFYDGSLDEIHISGESNKNNNDNNNNKGNYYTPSFPSPSDAGRGDKGAEPHKSGGGNGGSATKPIKPSTPKNPCDNINYQFTSAPKSADFRAKIKELKGATSESYETGYSMDKSGNFTELKRDGNHRLQFSPKQGDIGFMHTHPTTPMFSPADFFRYRGMLNMAARTSDYGVEDVYGIVMHGNNNYYMLKFDGDYKEVKYQGGDNSANLDNMYIQFARSFGGDLETAFIKFVEEKILNNQTFKEAGFHLYKLELNKDGTLKKSTEKYLDGNRKKPKDC